MIALSRERTPMHSPITGGDPAHAALPPLDAVTDAIAMPRGMGRTRIARIPRFHRVLMRAMSIAVGLSVAWAAACIYEWGTGRRVLPWDPYAGCGATQPAQLPATVRVGLYEEFPAPWRLERLKHIDFPVTLAVAAPSRNIFMKLRDTITRQYPQVRSLPMSGLDEPTASADILAPERR